MFNKGNVCAWFRFCCFFRLETHHLMVIQRQNADIGLILTSAPKHFWKIFLPGNYGLTSSLRRDSYQLWYCYATVKKRSTIATGRASCDVSKVDFLYTFGFPCFHLLFVPLLCTSNNNPPAHQCLPGSEKRVSEVLKITCFEFPSPHPFLPKEISCVNLESFRNIDHLAITESNVDVEL